MFDIIARRAVGRKHRTVADRGQWGPLVERVYGVDPSALRRK
jgi:hypothetical protein